MKTGHLHLDVSGRVLRSVRSLWIAASLAFLLLLAPTARAQDTGYLSGSVTDQTGAAVAGAEVVVTSAGGSLTRTTTTNTDGAYVVAGLPGGTYDVVVTEKGFEKYEVKGVKLDVAEKRRLDVQLAMGKVTEEVVVEGQNVAQVETESSELGGTITGKQLLQLELNGRNFTQLVTLTPGVTNQSGQDEGTVGVYGTVAYSVNGGRTEYNNWEVDGGNNLDDGSNTTLQTYPSLDAIAEVRVLTSNYGAQYGRNSSGTVEVETKSGTKSFHGDVYEFVRNDAFNARNFFLSKVPPYKKNDYGYTFGGPFFIPGHYNTDKSKTFFFWSQEWRKDRLPVNFNSAVPSLAERGCTTATPGCVGTVGDFSELCPGPDCPINPATVTLANPTGSPFPSNRVPIDPNAAPLLGLIPLPTAGRPGAFFFRTSVTQPNDWREELIRVDHNFNSKLRLMVRYIHDSWQTLTPVPLWTSGTTFPTVRDTFIGPGVGFVTRMTAVASPTLLNEFVFTYASDHISFRNNGAWQRPAGYNLGLFQNGFGGGKVPGIFLNGGIFGGIGEDPGYVTNGPLNSNPVYTFRDNVSKLLGRHTLQFGGYFYASQKNEIGQPSVSPNGFINFGGFAGSTGNAFADLLTGNIASFQQANLAPKYYLRYKIFEPYLQDDWRITPRLTLNLGLRVSLYGTVRDRLHQVYNFDPSAYVQGATAICENGLPTGCASAPDGTVAGNRFNGLVQCGVAGVPVGCSRGHLFNPAPRLGFAWDPWGHSKTAVRGGYGIFFEHTPSGEGTATALEDSAPLVQTPVQRIIPTTFDPITGNIVTSGYSQVGVAGAQFPLGVVSIPNKQIWPYVQQWHLDVQHQVFRNTVAVVSYVGSKGTHLGRRLDLNQIRPVPLSANPYKPGEAMGATDCSTFTTPSGVAVTGQAAVNLSVICGVDATGAPFNVNSVRPFLGFASIRRQDNQADSTYHALQTSVRKTVGALLLTVSYTFSHSIDDASSGLDNDFVNSYDFHSNRASSNFDQRHVATISYVYDLPFFKGAGLKHTLLGGWQWSGITAIQSGAPFSVFNGGSSPISLDNAGVANGVANSVGIGSYVDVVGDPRSGIPNVSSPGFGPLFYNPGAFVAPRGLTFGNAGRNFLRNPRQTNFDMAVFKRFDIRESMSVEFRTEAFNVFNHTEWGYLAGGGGSAANNSAITSFSNSVTCYAAPPSAPTACLTPSFLRPSSAHNARILQLGLKFIF